MAELNDARLAAIARGDDVATAVDIQDMAAELLRSRKLGRGDSRRSLQVRRLRWSVENLIVKVEMWFESAPANNEQLLGALAKVCDRLRELHEDVKSLPLELEELGIAALISKWLTSEALLNAIEAREWSDIPDELATRIDRGEWKAALHG